MLSVRIRAPEELVDSVLALLRESEACTDIGHFPEAFDRPASSLVIVAVAREAATDVIERLRDLRLDELGSISIDPIDTVLSRRARAAERAAPGDPEDGVVWESLEQKVRDDATLSWAFIAFLTLATLIAGVGRITDQPILIVGAMVVGPDFSPVAAICLALALRRWGLLLPASRTLSIGFLVATAIATVIWWFAYLFGAFTHHQAATGPLTDFIVSPDAWSFVVALFAGMAGMLSLSTAKSGPLVGVFISVTTVPAVGTFAVCLAAGVWSEVGRTVLQLAINIAGMIVSGTLTLVVQHVLLHARTQRTS